MLKRVKKSFNKEQVLGLLDPIISEWFNNHFKDLTPAQAQAIPLIDQRRNVLVASPTGSGKTLTAFLMILNQLFELGKHKKLENKVYCIYISPLKALANDIERNLNQPLKQIKNIAAEHGLILPDIRVGVRTGDTTPAERQRMTRKSPHILITTPESLSIVIATKRFRLKLLDTQFLILDEIHEICSSKRGTHLSLSIEWLQNQIFNADKSSYNNNNREFVRIGLSATQAPINDIARFMGGYDQNNKPRVVNLVEVSTGKMLDLRVICPVDDINTTPFEIINTKMYEILETLIKEHRTTLIFTNTRRGAETVAFKLHERGFDNIAAHHGSLSKETRFEVEEKLKNGELKATICSTSLELGIDVGYIDLVCQLGSPKSIAKGLQRIGRSGHALHEMSKGRIIIFDRDDLVEAAVLVKNVYDGNIDRIKILKNNLDVLAQILVGMSLERRWKVDEAFNLIKQSYCYHTLSKRIFLKVLNYLSGNQSMSERGIYGKISYDPEDQTFGIRWGARTIYYLNLGTIPQEVNYRVVIIGTGYNVGMLSEKFVEHLNSKDIFVLGGKTYEFIQTKGMSVYVRNAQGRKPTVPSWFGEMLPRSFDLAQEIGVFRAELNKRLEKVKGVDKQTLYLDKIVKDVEDWLKNEYYLDQKAARSIINYFIGQKGIIQHLPTNKNVLIEGYLDANGYHNIIFHYCFGRRVNDALSRAYAFELSKQYGATVRISLTDDNFMLTLHKKINLYGLEHLVPHERLKETIRKSLATGDLIKQRFRHCAVRSFMILRNYKGNDISVRKQMQRAQNILEVLTSKMNENTLPKVVIDEAYNEILFEVLDLEHAYECQKNIDSKKIMVNYSNYSKVPSPYAHNVILVGISDLILMEDRNALLRELDQKVHNIVFGELESEVSTSGQDLEPIEKIPVQEIENIVVERYLFDKMFSKAQNINDYFKKYGIAFSLREIFIRTKKFSLKAWDKLLSSKDHKGRKLFFGRFLNGRVCYVPESDVPLYVSTYREAELDNKELTVLRIIQTHCGITRRELTNKLDARQIDLKEIINKLERNLYIIRLPPVQGVVAGAAGAANKYVFYDLKKRLEKGNLEIIKRIIHHFGPITIFEIRNLTGFASVLIDARLEHLINTGQVIKFRTTGFNQFEMFISKDEYNDLKHKVLPELTQTSYVRILSLFDSVSFRHYAELRTRFGDGWFAPIFYYNIPVGKIDLWRLASCIEVKDLEFDPVLLEEVLKIFNNSSSSEENLEEKQQKFKLELFSQTLKELDDLMEYYGLYGLDIIRIRNIFGQFPDSFSEEIKEILLNSGYVKIQGFYIKGAVDHSVFSNKQLMSLILKKQHVLSSSHFVNPLDAIRTMGGIRSNFEMRLRLDGKFYDIKEFRKNLDLFAGPIIPDNISYCTEKDIKIYKAAKGRELDYFMEYVLENMPDTEPISSGNLFARLSLSKNQYNTARKRLYEGLYIIRNPMQKYEKVENYRNLTKQYARKFVLKRIIKNFGIFSAESLSAFTRREYSMKELRQILRDLEADGVVKKGFFKMGDDTLFWMIKDDLNNMKNSKIDCNMEMDHYLIISPQDQLANYLSAEVRKKFGLNACFIIMKDCELIGAFKIKQYKTRVQIIDIICPEDTYTEVEKFFRLNKLDIIDEDAEKLYTYEEL